MVRLLIVIPTRNRAELAEAAIKSVLSQKQPGLHLLLSDNSTEITEAKRLEEFCTDLGPQVQYARSPKPMAMSKHWQWALEQGLKTEPTHVTFVTDRILIKRGRLENLLPLVRENANVLISYNHDRIIDLRQPVTVEQVGWSGELLRIESKELLRNFSQAKWHPALPRMLNCIVPVDHLNEISQRFGTVFSSFSPDICFGFRYLASFPAILFYDRAPIFHYALARSNGASHGRGIQTKDSIDFAANISEPTQRLNAPVPEFNTVMNWVLHEYSCVAETGDHEFPRIDLPSYFAAIAQEREWMEDDELKERTSNLLDQALIEHGIKLSVAESCTERCDLPVQLPHHYRNFKTLPAAIRFAERHDGPRGLSSSSSLIARARQRLRLRSRINQLVHPNTKFEEISG